MFFAMALVATTLISCDGFANKTAENDSTLVDSIDTVQVDSMTVDSVVVDSVVAE
jgi:hypothetical protein